MLIALWVILIVLMAWLALTELPAGWDGHYPWPFLIALTPFLWIGFAVVGVVGLCVHEWAFAGCAAVALVASLLRKTSYYLNDLKSPNTAAALARHLQERKQGPARPTDRDITRLDDARDGRFRVMTLNCRFGNADAAEIVTMVREQDVAVLALQECSPELIERLDAQGLRELLPYRQLGDPQPNDNGGFNGVWLRVEPSQSTPTGCPIPAADVPTVTLPLSSTRDIVFASAHPKSPQRSCREWSMGIIGLRALATAPAEDGHERITVVMGDLNSSVPHPSFRKLLAGGFHDAALDEAAGQHTTFPSWLPWPRIVLDHVLFTDHLRASQVRSVKVTGSDHLALLATLTIERRSEPANPAARESWPESLPPIRRKERA